MLIVQRLAGVLLEMQALDADRDRLAVRRGDRHLALAHDRRLVLADLVALRQVGIEIILPVEHRFEIDPGLEPEPGAHRLPDAFPVDDRQHAGHGGIDQRDVGIGLAAELGRGAREQLGVRGHLGMDLEADHDLPVAGRALDELRSSSQERSFRARSYVTMPVIARPRQAAQPRCYPIRRADGPRRPAPCRLARTSSAHCRGRPRRDADRRAPRRSPCRLRP